MHRLTVQYFGPTDAEDFDKQYANQHVPLVHALPGLTAFTTSKPQALGAGEVPYLVAELDFADGDAFQSCMRTEEMGRTAADAQTLRVAAMVMFVGEVAEPAR